MKNSVVYVDALMDQNVSRLAEKSLRQTLRTYLDSRAGADCNFTRIALAGKNAVAPGHFARHVLELEPQLVILSGCEKNISDIESDKWVQDYCASLRTLTDRLREAHNTVKAFALFGICFGHQALAYVHGARVKRVGPHAGLVACYPVATTNDHPFASIANEHRPIPLIAFHKDQVSETPLGFERIFYSHHCRIQSVLHKTYPMLGIQSHPEFTPQIVERKQCDPAWSRCKQATLAQHQGFQLLNEIYRWAKL